MYRQPFPVSRVLSDQPPAARAALRAAPQAPNLQGEVLLYPYLHGTLVLVRAAGLPHDGFLGFHIHEHGACDPGGAAPFASAGGHYNPTHAEHPNHTGDLPPLLVSGGQAFAVFYTGRFSPGEVLGRAVVIHDMRDDFHTQPAGDAGARIACGVIARV